VVRVTAGEGGAVLVERSHVVIQASAAPGSVVTCPPRAADGCDADLPSLLRARPDGRLVTSVGALAGSAEPLALHRARRAVARLDATDCEVSVEVWEVDDAAVFEIVWTPVTTVVDMMLDWDLLELEIALAELAEWLGVTTAVATRALDRLARYAGVTVRGPSGDAVVRVRLDVDGCPLTTSTCGARSDPA
jgi:hypothetical protein